MRKLVLFGLLGGVFGLALLLERFVTRPSVKIDADSDQLAFVIGGGTPRELPEIPVAPPADPAPEPGRRTESKPAGRPANDGGSRGGAASAKERPAAPPARPDARDPAVRDHVVEKGETLSSIAKAELGAALRWRDLAKWNGLDESTPLKIGTRLRLSSPDDAKAPASAGTAPKNDTATAERTHKIAKGDTLSRIAALYLGDASRWREIQRLNGISDAAAGNLTEGATLRLPQR